MSRVRADKYTDKGGSGAPLFPNGVRVTGVATATTFDGNVTGNVTGTTGTFSGNVSVGGTLTYEDVKNIDSVGLITARTGINVTAGGIKIVGGGLTVTGISTFNSATELSGVIETVSAATTYMSGSQMVLEMDVLSGTTYSFTNVGSNIGIVSFKNMPADNQGGTTITLLHTQNSSITAGVGNTIPEAGLGITCTVVPYSNGAALTGISTAALVGSGTSVTLSTTNSDRDFVSFFIHYTGGTNTTASSYQIYGTKNGGFRQG